MNIIILALIAAGSLVGVYSVVSGLPNQLVGNDNAQKEASNTVSENQQQSVLSVPGTNIAAGHAELTIIDSQRQGARSMQ